MNWLLKRMMGLEKPTGMSTDGSLTYKMKKALPGHLGVLFLDDEKRITRQQGLKCRGARVARRGLARIRIACY